MDITFLGTGTSMGVPVAGGFGSENSNNDPRDQRYRCSVWVRTEQVSLVIDVGPEFRLQTLRAGIRHIDALLITHEHTDHIGGLDDLRAFNYAQNQTIPVYTSRKTASAIKNRFNYMFKPKKTPGSVDMAFNYPDQKVTVGDCTITPIPVKHGTMDVMGFRINDFCYITDVSYIPEKSVEKIKGSRVVVMSGLRWDPPHPTHFTIPEAIEVSKILNVEKTYLTHISPYVNHKEVSQKLPHNVYLSYDQLRLCL